MLLDYCLDYHEEFAPELSSDGLSRLSAFEKKHAFPLPVRTETVLAVATSNLLKNALAQSREKAGGPGEKIRDIESVPPMAEAEFGRIVAKGRDLFDHCLTQRSKVCITGFMEHELGKKSPPLGALLDFLGWMVERRIEIAEQISRPIEERVEDLAWSDVMIDECVAIIHGVSVTGAEKVAADKQP